MKNPPFVRVYREFRVFFHDQYTLLDEEGATKVLQCGKWIYLHDNNIKVAMAHVHFIQANRDPKQRFTEGELLGQVLSLPCARDTEAVLELYWLRALYNDPYTRRPPIPPMVSQWWKEMGFTGHPDSWELQLERKLGIVRPPMGYPWN
jgi:hypothetical protein